MTLEEQGSGKIQLEADSAQKEIPRATGGSAGLVEDTGKTLSILTLDFENNIYFRLGKTNIDDQGIQTLMKHAERLKNNTKLFVTLIGHTDNLGSPAYNQAISDARLSAVARILKEQGVSRHQIRRISLGNERRKTVLCRTDECRQTMRRVELTYGTSR